MNKLAASRFVYTRSTEPDGLTRVDAQRGLVWCLSAALIAPTLSAAWLVSSELSSIAAMRDRFAVGLSCSSLSEFAEGPTLDHDAVFVT